MSQLLRPIINSDHIVLTVKLDCKWADVPPEKRAVVLGGFEELASITEQSLNEKETSDAKPN